PEYVQMVEHEEAEQEEGEAQDESNDEDGA
ncbi:hypothetical protein A2U01_0112549, partial [Trifolium medium]|nr:hypothetical protein [Trifolium medium]